jgi:hypothetical protein
MTPRPPQPFETIEGGHAQLAASWTEPAAPPVGSPGGDVFRKPAVEPLRDAAQPPDPTEARDLPAPEVTLKPTRPPTQATRPPEARTTARVATRPAAEASPEVIARRRADPEPRPTPRLDRGDAPRPREASPPDDPTVGRSRSDPTPDQAAARMAPTARFASARASAPAPAAELPRLRPSRDGAPVGLIPALNAGDGPHGEAPVPKLEISIGRIVVERPMPLTTPAAASQGAGPARGFSGFSAARRGFLR